MVQGDLFQAPHESSVHRHVENSAQASFLERYRISIRLDQCLVLSLILLVLHIWTFSLGVERGRRWMNADLARASVKTFHQARTQPDMTPPVSAPLPAGVSSLPVSQQDRLGGPAVTGANAVVEVPVRSIKSDESQKGKDFPAGKFTIQLVTYLTQEEATRKISELGTKGYSGFVIPSGKYLQICVNGFENRQNASSLLREMKGRGLAPSDAYVRSIPALG